MQRRVVNKQAIKRAVSQSTKDSARLEGRIVPSDFVRSERAEQFLAERRQGAS